MTHACEEENADGRVSSPRGEILELVTYTPDGVVIGLGKQEIVEQVLSEGGAYQENVARSQT